MLKKCPECKNTKPKDDFYNDKSTRDKLSCYCKGCNRKKVKNWRINNGEKNREIDRKQNLRKYGLTSEEYYKIHEKQGGVCAICGKRETQIYLGKLLRLSVDHNHKTGETRGLLCRKCNCTIGNVNENTGTLEEMIKYLEKPSLLSISPV